MNYIAWRRIDIVGAIRFIFDYFERQDEIVGFIHIHPKLLKALVFSIGDEIEFDFIPEGVGMIRTAYLKFAPNIDTHQMAAYNQEKSIGITINLV